MIELKPDDCEALRAEVQQCLAQLGMPSEDYSIETLGANIAAVKDAIDQGMIRPPVTRVAWREAIVKAYQAPAAT